MRNTSICVKKYIFNAFKYNYLNHLFGLILNNFIAKLADICHYKYYFIGIFLHNKFEQLIILFIK